MVLISDVDGTIFERGVLGRDALPGIGGLKACGVPLVLLSSKTLEEMEIIHGGLGLDAPFSFENGAGIAFPVNEGTGKDNEKKWKIELTGPDTGVLRGLCPLIEDATGKNIVLLEEMELKDLMDWTGLSAEGARMAKMRRASMPFLTADRRPLSVEEKSRLNVRLQDPGYRVTWGGRFHHLLAAGSGKGKAVGRLRFHYLELSKGSVTMVGIGDSENDFGLLDAVDIPYLVRSPESDIDYGKLKYRVTMASGPRGFSEAVAEIWGE